MGSNSIAGWRVWVAMPVCGGDSLSRKHLVRSSAWPSSPSPSSLQSKRQYVGNASGYLSISKRNGFRLKASDDEGENAGDDEVDESDFRFSLDDEQSFDLAKTVELTNTLASLPNEEAPRITGIIENWKKEGNPISSRTLLYLMRKLHSRRRLKHALKVAEYLKKCNSLDKIGHFEMIGRSGMFRQARGLFEELSEEEKTEDAYNAMLVVYSQCGILPAAEHLFNKMKEKKLLTKSYSFNLMASLYNKKRKAAKVIYLMDTANKHGIECDSCFQNNLLAAKAKVEGIESAEELFREMMKKKKERESKNASLIGYMTMARIYLEAEMKSKAEEILIMSEKKIENGEFEKSKKNYAVVMTMYASVGKLEGVERIWDALLMSVGSDLKESDYCCLLRCFGKLGEVEKAEKAFKEMKKKMMMMRMGGDVDGDVDDGDVDDDDVDVDVSVYKAMMYVYANAGVPKKCEVLKGKMMKKKMMMDAWCYNHMINAYVKRGQTNKAIGYLKESMNAGRINRRFTPLHSSFIIILNSLADEGDVDKAEKLFKEWESDGWRTNVVLFNKLLQVYNSAKRYSSGFSERMNAAKVKPNFVTSQLSLKQEEYA